MGGGHKKTAARRWRHEGTIRCWKGRQVLRRMKRFLLTATHVEARVGSIKASKGTPIVSDFDQNVRE